MTIEGVRSPIDKLLCLQQSFTEAANAGATTLATVSGSVLIEAIIVKMVTYHADMTSIAVTGGASNVIDFITALEGAAANLDDADDQVGWEGKVELGDATTIEADFAGTGANNVTVLVSIVYRAITDGAVLS